MAEDAYARVVAQEKLMSAAASWLASYHYFQSGVNPGPNDDAEAGYHDDMLLDAAREFVKLHESVRTAMDDAKAHQEAAAAGDRRVRSEIQQKLHESPFRKPPPGEMI